MMYTRFLLKIFNGEFHFKADSSNQLRNLRSDTQKLLLNASFSSRRFTKFVLNVQRFCSFFYRPNIVVFWIIEIKLQKMNLKKSNWEYDTAIINYEFHTLIGYRKCALAYTNIYIFWHWKNFISGKFSWVWFCFAFIVFQFSFFRFFHFMFGWLACWFDGHFWLSSYNLICVAMRLRKKFW